MSTYTNVVKSAIIGLLALGATAAHAVPEQLEGFDDNEVLYHVYTVVSGSETQDEFDWNDVGG